MRWRKRWAREPASPGADLITPELVAEATAKT